MGQYNKKLRIIANVVLFIMTLLCILPLILLVVSSFTAEEVLVQNGYSFFPAKWGLDAYAYLWKTRATLLQAYKMTFIVTTIGVVSSLTVTTLFAYGLSKKTLPGRSIFAFMVFFSMLFNGGLVPSYLMWTQTFHIKDTIFALLLPNLLMNGFTVIVMRSFFQTSIPEELLEAAKLDGAGEWRILGQIVLPLSKPILTTVTLLSGLGYWNDWLNGLYYINNDKLYSIQVLLNKMLLDVQYLMSGASGGALTQSITLPATGIKMAVAVMGALPILVVYPFFQKYFVKGIVIGAVKG